MSAINITDINREVLFAVGKLFLQSIIFKTFAKRAETEGQKSALKALKWLARLLLQPEVI